MLRKKAADMSQDDSDSDSAREYDQSPAELRVRAERIRKYARFMSNDPAVPKWIALADELDALAAAKEKIGAPKQKPEC